MKTILCVDDDISALTALRTVLSKFLGPGHEIEIAESGEEALEIQRCMFVQGQDL
jgi:CheY-like chemotaxis protein